MGMDRREQTEYESEKQKLRLIRRVLLVFQMPSSSTHGSKKYPVFARKLLQVLDSAATNAICSFVRGGAPSLPPPWSSDDAERLFEVCVRFVPVVHNYMTLVQVYEECHRQNKPERARGWWTGWRSPWPSTACTCSRSVGGVSRFSA